MRPSTVVDLLDEARKVIGAPRKTNDARIQFQINHLTRSCTKDELRQI